MELNEALKERNLTFTPSLSISIYSLEKLPLIELEGNKKDNLYNRVRLAIKEVTNFRWDNNILCLTNTSGDEFAIAVYLSPKKWEINLWDSRGAESVGTWYMDYKSNDDVLCNEIIQDMSKRMSEFSSGIIHCSDSSCGATIPKNRNVKKTDAHEKEYGGSYFAGVYCKDCWERKWRAIEARETYD